MFNIYNKKNRKIVTVTIAILLVLAMIVPMIVSALM